MNKYELLKSEIDEIDDLINEMTSEYLSVDDADFLKNAIFHAHELPRRLRVFLNDFKYLERKYGYCLVSGYPIDEDKIGPTPAHWDSRSTKSPTLEEEMFLILLGSLLGDPIAWMSQQNGYIAHDILPIKDNEYEQLGTGSRELLWWHNEDAFHPYRGDYLGMMCLRNPDKVATTIASIDMVEIKPEHVGILFEPRYTIRPDNSHLEKNRPRRQVESSGSEELMGAAYNHINEMNSRPQKISVLFGDPKSPYLRIDPFFMERLEDDHEGQAALDSLIRAIDGRLLDLTLDQGDIIFIDNYKTVHGRRPFMAKYDGTDRWLKRINITRNLRVSRSARVSCTSRIIC